MQPNSEHTLYALLDAPSSESLAMCAIATLSPLTPESLWMHDGTRASVHDKRTVESSMGGHWMFVDHLQHTLPNPEGRIVAGWVGATFRERCEQLSIPTPNVPSGSATTPFEDDVRSGAFWLAPPAVVFSVLVDWHMDAAKIACSRKDFRIARLLDWSLPDRVESAAAQWYTAPDKHTRERIVVTYYRVFGGSQFRSQKACLHAMRGAAKRLAGTTYQRPD